MTTPRPIERDDLPSGRGEALSLVRELFKDASRAHRKLIPTWNRNYRLVRNRGWSDFRAAWLPSPSSSEVYPTIHTLVSYLTSQNPVPTTSAFPPADLPVRADQQLLAKKAEWMDQDMRSWQVTSDAMRHVRTSLWDSFMYGCGILKTGYDLSANDGEGAPTLVRADPYTILPDPTASSINDLRYLIEARDAPVFEVRRRFPHTDPTPGPTSSWATERRPEAASLEVVPNANLAATGVTGLFPGTPTPGIPSRFAYPRSGSPFDYTETVRLIECWVREADTISVPVIQEGERVDDITIDVPRWRLIVVAGEEVIHDDDNPFTHNQLPYVRLPMVEIGEWWSMSLAEHLAPLQIAINRLLAALQQNAEITGNPVLIDYTASNTSRTNWQARPGTRTTAASPQVKPEWMDPPRMPDIYLQLVNDYRAAIDRISGISDVARGQALRRREPAQAVDSAQEASFTRIGDVLRNMEDSLRGAYDQVASNIAQYSIEHRDIPIVGPDNPTPTSYLSLPPKAYYYPVGLPDNKVEDYQVAFRVAIEAGSSLPLSHQARAAELMALLFAGVVDPIYVLSQLKPPGWQEVAQRLQSQPMPQPQAGGKNPRRR